MPNGIVTLGAPNPAREVHSAPSATKAQFVASYWAWCDENGIADHESDASWHYEVYLSGPPEDSLKARYAKVLAIGKLRGYL